MKARIWLGFLCLSTPNLEGKVKHWKMLRKVKGVIEAHLLYGVHDMVAVVEVDTVDRVKEVVSANIRRIEGVRSTLTMIVMEGKG